jgi:DNA-binding MarR family transcriptional regulator
MDKQKELETLQSRISHHLGRVHHLLVRIINKDLTDKGLQIKIEQFPVLFTAYFGDNLSQQDIAKKLFKDKAGIQRTVRTLEAEGCVRIEADPDDKRKNIIQITDKGTALCQDIMEKLAKYDNEIMNLLEPGEAEIMVNVLIRLRTHMEQLIDYPTNHQD